MAFLRRGNVRIPHRKSAIIDLHRIGQTPIAIYIDNISHWEEHRINEKNNLVFMWFTTGSMISVTESFETVDELVNGKAVAP